MEPIIILHGGAGTISNDARAHEMLEAIKKITTNSYKILTSNEHSVLDAVEQAVNQLEDNELFNAGYGSVLNDDGYVEMDASIMLGSNLAAGAVTVVKTIKNPISLARVVMEKTEHVLMAAEGAENLAGKHNIAKVPPTQLITDYRREQLKTALKNKAMDTVGAVAIDRNGRLAAATSTGGRDQKMAGRSSDTCMLGSGTYADDNSGAVSTTGHGETIAKFCLAHAIVKSIESGLSAQEATSRCIKQMTDRLKNCAGAITISKSGEVGVDFSTSRMVWAYQKGNQLHFGLDQNQHEIETV